MTIDDRTLVDFDQHSLDYRARFPEISHEVRSRCPVAWTDHYGGYWVISGRDVIGEMAKHPDLLSNDHDPAGVRRGYGGIAIPSPQGGTNRGGFIEMDPPEQLEYRRVLNPYLSPSAIDRWRPMVRELSHACIDEIIESGRLDFVDDLANIVPAVLTMGMLGFPLRDWVIYCEPAHALVYTPPHSPDFPRVLDGTMRMVEQLAEEMTKAESHPRPGMLKALMDAKADGASFVDDDILGTLVLLIGGGFDTTTSLTSHALTWLDVRLDQRQALLSDPDLLDTATEEFVRYVSPAQGGGRTITQDCQIAGHSFHSGDRVWMAYSLANRDPESFEGPDQIVLDRFPNRHAGFGLGVHRCIGSNLARMTFKTMLTVVLDRLGDYRLEEDGAVRYEDIGTINGYQHLPAGFSPGTRQGRGLEQVI
ncbi:MAG: cytochrome P450, partial [Acidimicrobiales bacterium]